MSASDRAKPVRISSVAAAIVLLALTGVVGALFISAANPPLVDEGLPPQPSASDSTNDAATATSSSADTAGAADQSVADEELRRKGLSLLDGGNFTAALPLLQSYLERHGGDTRAREAYAQSLWLSGKNDEAVAEYRRLILSQPPDAELNYRIAVILRQSGEDGDSLSFLREAVALAPDNPIFRSELGKSLITAGSYAAGMKELKRAIRSAPASGQMVGTLYAELGTAYQRNGDTADAQRAYLKALRADPGNEYFGELLKQGK